MLKEYPTSEAVLTAGESRLAESVIELLFHYQKHLSDLEDRIVALANEMEEYKIIQSIPGIRRKNRSHDYL
jgi:hypothetical protein